MSYLLDKKNQRKKMSIAAVLCVILFLFIYFRTSVWDKVSRASSFVFHPLLTTGNAVENKFSGIKVYFQSKNSLANENINLKGQLESNQATLANYNSVLDENTQLKEVLGRKNEKANMVVAGILSKPNQSLYDTLMIDAGASEGVVMGDKVFALGNIPIGRVAEVSANSSKVILFSNPGEKTNVVIPASSDQPAKSGGNTFMQLTGRGGGNFEMPVMEGITLAKGAEVALPGVTPYTVATVVTTTSDPRDSFQKALLVSPVNIEEIKFVQVEKF